MSGTVLVVILGIIVIGIGAYAGYRNQKREDARTAQLFQWATNQKWQFAPADDNWCVRWQGAPFGEGDHRRARNVIEGVSTHGTPFAAFDYSYQTHSTDGEGHRSTTTHRYSVCSLRLPAYLPRLQVTTENLFTRLGNALGATDIELESEDFNRAFRVHCDDAKFASDVLSARTMQLLLSRPHLCWRVEGLDIVCWYDGEQSPSSVIAAVATLGDVVAGIPQFVWHDHGYDAGTPAPGGGGSP
jgi:hypothetical protein